MLERLFIVGSSNQIFNVIFLKNNFCHRVNFILSKVPKRVCPTKGFGPNWIGPKQNKQIELRHTFLVMMNAELIFVLLSSLTARSRCFHFICGRCFNFVVDYSKFSPLDFHSLIFIPLSDDGLF